MTKRMLYDYNNEESHWVLLRSAQIRRQDVYREITVAIPAHVSRALSSSGLFNPKSSVSFCYRIRAEQQS